MKTRVRYSFRSTSPLCLLVLFIALAALAIVLLFWQAPPAHAAAITVNTTLDTIANDGKCSLREAIINANNDDQSGSTECTSGAAGLDTITITATGIITLASKLPTITSTITIVGPGAGVLTISGNNVTQVAHVDGLGTLNLSGVTLARAFGITGGAIVNSGILRITDSVFFSNTVNAGSGASGAAIWTGSGSTLNITNTQFYFNAATGPGANGGAIHNFDGTVTIVDSYFSGNSATSLGGAIENESNRLNITNTDFTNNSASSGGGVYNSPTGSGSHATFTGGTFFINTATSGGGIYNAHALTMTNGTFSANSATDDGGSIYTSNYTATISNTIFYSHTATRGGGIFNNFGVLNISNSTLYSNTASTSSLFGSGAGGGIYSNGGSADIANSTLHGNTAGRFTGSGGGIYTVGGTTILNSSTLFDNTASGFFASGGGIYITGTLRITNSTIAGNFASGLVGGGGGIRNGAGGTLYLTNSTVAGNGAPLGAGGGISTTGTVNSRNTIFANNTASADANCSGSVGDVANNLQWNPSSGCAFALAPGDPKLAPLANYGGPTQTMPLYVGSTAIDAGTNTLCPAKDQRGVTRPINGICDIGAVEGTFYPVYLPLILK